MWAAPTYNKVHNVGYDIFITRSPLFAEAKACSVKALQDIVAGMALRE